MIPGMTAGPLMGAVSSLQQPLPPPTPGPYQRRPNMFDREHISETLAALAAGFGSSRNIGEAAAAAASNFHGLRQGARQRLRGPIPEIGGPNNGFEITTDPETGQRSYREIPEFRAAREAEQERSRAPSAADRITMRGQVMSSILRAPPEQRAALYQRVLADSERLFGGIDLALPPQWDEATASVMAEQAIRPETRMTEELRRDTLEHRVENDNRNYQLRANKAAEVSARRQAPPSTRRGSGASARLPAGFILD